MNGSGITLANGGFVSAGRESAGPGNVIRIGVDDRSAGIDCGTTPLRATVEAGEDDGFCSDGDGNELAVTAKPFEVFQSPAMGSRSALGEQFLGKALAGERSGYDG